MDTTTLIDCDDIIDVETASLDEAVEHPVPMLFEPEKTYNPTEDGAARRLADQYFQKEFLFDDVPENWYMYDGKRWRQVSSRHLENDVVALGDDYRTDASSLNGKAQEEVVRFATHLESQRTVQNVVTAASRHCGFDGSMFDADANSFNVMNGTIKLGATSSIKEHCPTDWITKVANAVYDADATCPQWEAFIDWITDSDIEIAEFLQELLGTALLGQNPDRKIIALHGPGRNGKSLILKVLRDIFGDYAQDAPSDLLVQKASGGGASPEIARMKGIRLACLDDPDIASGQATAVDNLKRLSGDQNIVGRPLYGKHIEFRSAMLPLIAWNKVPDLHGGGGDAMWDRLAMFEFHNRPENPDPNLETKLLEESDGILQWLIEGLERRLKRGSLVTPNAILETTERLRGQKDSAGDFVDRCVLKAEGKRVTASDLYSAYKDWCTANLRDVHNQSRLKACMEKAGYEQRKISSFRWIDVEVDIT